MKQIKPEMHIEFMGRRKLAMSISVVLILVSVAALALRGLNFGVDFTGGSLLEIGYEQEADLPDIRARLAAAGYPQAQVQNFGALSDVLIRILPQEGVESRDMGEQVLAVLKAGDVAVDLRRIEFVGPQVGDELTERGGTAMIFALLMILAYIIFRFQWKFAVGAIAALVHDVIITVGFFAVFQLSFDLSVLAAILAVIGYSLNDTIVVFDRIRENFLGVRKGTVDAIVNTSINQTLARTIVTGLTTLLVLVALLVLGGEALTGFSVALIVGIVIGTYSSIYTASSALLSLDIQPTDLLPEKKGELVDDLP